MRTWMLLVAVLSTGALDARPAAAAPGDAALAAMTEQVRDLERQTADQIADLQGDELSRVYRRLDRLTRGIAEVGGPRSASLLDRIRTTAAIAEISNPISEKSKLALIDAYIAIGEPARGLPLVRSLLSNTNPQRAWYGTELTLYFDGESRQAARLLAKIRQATLVRGAHELAPHEEAELAKLWSVASRAPGDASRVVYGEASNEAGFPKLMPQFAPASFRKIAAGSRRVEREITRWRTSMSLARSK